MSQTRGFEIISIASSCIAGSINSVVQSAKLLAKKYKESHRDAIEFLRQTESETVELENQRLLQRQKENVLKKLNGFLIRKEFEEKAENNLMKLLNAVDHTEIKKLEQDFIEEHKKAFSLVIENKVKNALTENGFSNFKNLQVKDGFAVFAEDSNGKAIISEFKFKGSETLLSTEVIGITDKSCEQILDNFQESLQKQGVKIKIPPHKKQNNGLPTLEVSKKIFKKKILNKNLKKIYIKEK